MLYEIESLEVAQWYGAGIVNWVVAGSILASNLLLHFFFLFRFLF
jgi:hypothetical protein